MQSILQSVASIFSTPSEPLPRITDLPAALRERVTSAVSRGFTGRAFTLTLRDGSQHNIGTGEPAFSVHIKTERGARAFELLDELALAEGYLYGDIDISGDFLALLDFRALMTDLHPLQYVMSTYLEGLINGQTRSDERWIKSHYDLPPEFFTLWLDERIRGYSHGFFAHDDESLEDGMERKFRYAMAAARIKPGDRVLDIGGGWGSFLEFAGKQGVHVTSITISDVSVKYMNEVRARLNLPCTIVKEHLLEFRSQQPFDAIVNLGVTEHLPDYQGSVKQYERLLKPGGRMYLDAYSGQRFQMPSFVLKWVYEGNTSPLNPKRYFAALEETSLEVMEFINDRHNYFLTCKKWAERLVSVHDQVAARWGELLYRRFLIYLWASAHSFHTGTLCAHHLVLEKPVKAPPASVVPRNFKLRS